jgi:ubiquitin-conjugating enzyme (huntingtin interacting protein 2)
MLMTNPKEFDRVASEWAEEYAHAPPRERSGTSSTANPPGKKGAAKSREQQEADRLAEYVLPEMRWPRR